MYIQSSIFTLWCQIVWYKIVLVPNCPRPRNNWIHQKSPTFTTEDQRYPPTNQQLPPIWLIVTVCTGLGACKIGRYNYNALSIEIKFALYLQKKRHIICVFFSGKNLKFTHQYLHFDKCFFFTNDSISISTNNFSLFSKSPPDTVDGYGNRDRHSEFWSPKMKWHSVNIYRIS